MDALNCLSYESIILLNKNRLLLPLVKAELIKDELSKIDIPEEEKSKHIETCKKKFNLNKINLKISGLPRK